MTSFRMKTYFILELYRTVNRLIVSWLQTLWIIIQWIALSDSKIRLIEVKLRWMMCHAKLKGYLIRSGTFNAINPKRVCPIGALGLLRRSWFEEQMPSNVNFASEVLNITSDQVWEITSGFDSKEEPPKYLEFKHLGFRLRDMIDLDKTA